MAKKPKRTMPGWLAGPAYAAVRMGAAALQTLDINLSMRLARRAGGAFAQLPFTRGRLQRAIDHISWCFPEWPAEQVREYAIESYRHMCCLGAEMAAAPRLLTQDGYAEYVQIATITGVMSAMLRPGPVVLIAAHCGNWELLGYTMALLGFPMHALYRPLDSRPLDEWLQRTRRRRGLVLVDKFQAARSLPGIFDKGYPVAFIADQNAGDRGLFVPFFNRLASTYKAPGLMAIRYRCPVVCGVARRLSGLSAQAHAPHEVIESQHFRYRMELTDVIEPHEWENQPDPLFYITARYRRAIETMIRRAPEQCLWMHRYWKSRPAFEREGGPFPARLLEKIRALPWIAEGDVERIVAQSAVDGAEWRSRHARAG
ncbi:MAG: lysophospholipid acyltransferase family protein [Phycisphaerales bacterium]|nr:lysophospholipid acyltransferase family protein [Phycisphaerales bacterium]